MYDRLREIRQRENEHARKAKKRTAVLRNFLTLGLLMILVAVTGAGAIGAAHAQSNNPVDLTQIWGWFFLGGLLVIVIVAVVAFSGSGASPKHIGAGFTFGVALILIAVAWAFIAPPPGAVAPPPTTQSQATVAVSLPYVSAYPSGQTQTVSPLSVQADIVMNSSTSAGALCLQNGVGSSHACAASAHNYVVIPIELSRTDNINATEGFTLCLNGLPTLTNSSTGIQYSPIGYTPSTSSSPGIWKVQWSSGSIGGSNPTQPAPSTTSNVACDLVGVPAFGSKIVDLSISLGGSNSTSANFGYLATQYTNYPLQISISGGAGASTPTVPVNFEFTGSKAA